MKKMMCAIGLVAVFGGTLAGATITITTPHGGETWSVGDTIPIAWAAEGTLQVCVNILLFQNGSKVMEIAMHTPNNGHYSWTVPAGVAPGSYNIRMWTADDVITALSGSFMIVKKAVVEIPPNTKPAIPLPRLVISDVKVGCTSDGFVITFGYKNAGSGALPRASEMPAKPTFRVLVDSRVIGSGNLFIPDTPAPPGWSVDTFHGGVIPYLPGTNMNFSWFIGNIVTVKINENKVNGMDADTQSYNLKPMALECGYDVLITGVNLDWTKQTITMRVRLEGQIGAFNRIMLLNNGVWCVFSETVPISPSQRDYVITRKLDCLRYVGAEGCLIDLCVFLVRVGAQSGDNRDIDQRNNCFRQTFHK